MTSPQDQALALVALGRTESTNTEAHHRAGAGAAHGTLLWAEAQTKGRGRHGREWISPPGNLYASFILRPACDAATATQLAFVAALGVGRFLSRYLDAAIPVHFKWPNDVLVSGRKIAGILAESTMGKTQNLEWVVLGVGINIETHPEGVEWPATSLRAQGGNPPEIAELVEVFGQSFLFCYNEWQEKGFSPIRKAWLERAAGLDEPVRVRLGEESFEGTFVGLDEDGALLVLKDGDKDPSRVTSGDVFPMKVLAGL
ncbi:MAG: biotin--[acetyl-CoA-carboxylase] ligase [Alphaproteobacteria bacterium]|nr:biotin--[acetyl-CoA-carboxylase] ligase [Alphaproteobacteria bacterium]